MQRSGLKLGGTLWRLQIGLALAAVIGIAAALSSCSSSSPLTSITVSPVSPATTLNGTVQFSATGTRSDGSTTSPSATWSTADGTIASISSGGLATGVAAGTTTVTATSGGVSGSTTLLVATSALQSIIISPTTATVSATGSSSPNSQQFTATGFFADGGALNITSSVNWNSSNTTVAVVGTNTGLATGFVVGSTTITANSGSITGNQATLTVIQ